MYDSKTKQLFIDNCYVEQLQDNLLARICSIHRNKKPEKERKKQRLNQKGYRTSSLA